MKFVDNIEDTQDSNEFKHYSVHEEFKNLARQKNATGQNLVTILCLRERSLMTSLVFWPFLTYLPTL